MRQARTGQEVLFLDQAQGFRGERRAGKRGPFMKNLERQTKRTQQTRKNSNRTADRKHDNVVPGIPACLWIRVQPDRL